MVLLFTSLYWGGLTVIEEESSDETMILGYSFNEFITYWYNKYGLYRIIGALYLPLFINTLNIIENNFLIVLVLCVFSLVFYIYSCFKYLKISFIYFPLSIFIVFSLPFWIPSSIMVAELSNLFIANILSASFLLFMSGSKLSIRVQTLFVFIYIIFSLLTYESHLVITFFIIMLSRNFNLKYFFLLSCFAVLFKFLILGYISSDPKLSSDLAADIDYLYLYLSKVTNKLYFTFNDAFNQISISNIYICVINLLLFVYFYFKLRFKSKVFEYRYLFLFVVNFAFVLLLPLISKLTISWSLILCLTISFSLFLTNFIFSRPLVSVFFIPVFSFSTYLLIISFATFKDSVLNEDLSYIRSSFYHSLYFELTNKR